MDRPAPDPEARAAFIAACLSDASRVALLTVARLGAARVDVIGVPEARGLRRLGLASIDHRLQVALTVDGRSVARALERPSP